MATGLLFFIAILVLSGVTSNNEIKRNIPINLIVVIVGALASLPPLKSQGVIAQIMQIIGPWASSVSPIWALVMVYLLTLVLTELVTNNAAAALMFPLSLWIGANPRRAHYAFCLSGSFCSQRQLYLSLWLSNQSTGI